MLEIFLQTLVAALMLPSVGKKWWSWEAAAGSWGEINPNHANWQQRPQSHTWCAFKPVLLPKWHFFPILSPFPNCFPPPLYHSPLHAMQTFEFTDNLNNLDEGTRPGEILPSKKTEVIFYLLLSVLFKCICVRAGAALRLSTGVSAFTLWLWGWFF